jgi:eukaryotic-like serine/threonine-protein kinase
MALCNECSSEIPENDSFCPFCGIAVAKPEISAVDDGESLESTLMMTPDEAARLVAETKSKDTGAPPSQSEEPSPSLPLAPSTAKETGSTSDPATHGAAASDNIGATPGDVFALSSIDEIPVPDLIDGTSRTRDDISVKPTKEYELMDPYDVRSPADSGKFDDVEERPTSAVEAEDPAISLVPGDNLPFEEPRTVSSDASSVGIEDTPTLEQPNLMEAAAASGDDIDTNIQTPEVGPEPESAVAKRDGIDNVDLVPEAESPVSSPFASDAVEISLDTEPDGDDLKVPEASAVSGPETMPASSPGPAAAMDMTEVKQPVLSDHSPPSGADSPGIAKPADELAPHDPFPANPTFDSVRIIEGHTPFSQDDVATILPGAQNAAVSDSPVEPPRSLAPEPSPSTETGHGMGAVDTDGRKTAKLKPLSEGAVLSGRYEIVRKIGGGGMGAVYLASDNNLGGVLRAVKEMVQAHMEEDQQVKAINDFKRESMILSTLDHPSIPTIYDYFYDESESRFYLVMKYISGGDMSARLRAAPEGRIDEATVTEWAIQIADVLDYLHNQPSTIVYRDLKPSNIMIDGNSGRVMLIDFGIARSISQKQEKGVTAVGTMGYAPPELFSGNVEPRSDIYSLGSTMFHLLTGADPQSNPLLIFDFHKNPRPRQINPQLSDQMERILMKSVEYNAEARFGSAAEMRKLLEHHLSDLRGGGLTYGTGETPVSVGLGSQQVFCGFCGQRIVATDLFCAFCGAKQPMAQSGVQTQHRAGVAKTAKLYIEGTSELSAPAYSLQKEENIVGRRDPMSNIFPEVDLSKYDPQTKISRRHARIWREGEKFLVEDLGSSNGTLLVPVSKDLFRLTPHQPHVLTDGDRLKIGDTTLHFIVS